MRKLLLSLAFSILILSPLALHAQDDNPFADLDPDAIFADGVEVVGVRYEATPSIVVDNDAREVHVFNSETGNWRTFPFLEQIEALYEPKERGDGTILFNQPFNDDISEFESGIPSLPQHELWLLNPSTGEFSQPNTVCGGYAQALSGEGFWVVYSEPRVNRTAVCDMETGEVAALLPDSTSAQWFIITGSPDGNWLLLNKWIPGDFNRYYYSVELVSGRTRYLGATDAAATTEKVTGWTTDTQGILLLWTMPESMSDTSFTFDSAVENSLARAMIGNAEYKENPERLEELDTGPWAIRRGSDTCRLERYDIASHIQTELILGDYCYGSVESLGSSYFYVSDFPFSTERALFELDTASSQSAILIDDEIVALESVSPDGRYALVGMKDESYDSQTVSAQLRDEQLDPFAFRVYGLPTTRVALIDLESQKVIAEISNWDGRAYWLTSTRFLMDDADPGINEIRLFEIYARRIVGESQFSLCGQFFLPTSPHGNYLVLDTYEQGLTPVIFDIDLKRFITIANIPVGVRWGENDLLNASRCRPNSFSEYGSECIIYTIRVDLD